MATKPEIPKGWRALKHGEVIQPFDRFWRWNTGPWQLAGSSTGGTSGQVYATHADKKTLIGVHGYHWLHIRKEAKK